MDLGEASPSRRRRMPAAAIGNGTAWPLPGGAQAAAHRTKAPEGCRRLWRGPFLALSAHLWTGTGPNPLIEGDAGPKRQGGSQTSKDSPHP